MTRQVRQPRARAFHAALTGAAGGAFSGLTGVGGGAIMVPLLTSRLNLGQHRAHGTSLAIITFVAASGVVGYWHAGNIDWRLVLALAPGGVLGVYAGARTMLRLPALQVRLLFGAFLLFVAFRQLVWHVSAGAPQGGIAGVLIATGFGFAGGALAGVLGVGGGAIFVPAIIIFGLAHVARGEDPQKVAQGVSLVVIVCTGLAGSITNWRQRTIDVATVRWVVPVAVAAALSASLLANRMDAAILKAVYGVTALALACQVLYTTARAFRGRPLIAEV
ncbi:MAG TPA: sulfite exporter TauE/SafE family protein [Dehalococcoidia bacterium]|nr:sulfite exporter TauE/SafE family protein [Dehalococcoidia bacterium]